MLLALTHRYDNPSANEATLDNMVKYIMWNHENWLYEPYKTTNDKNVYINYG